MRFHLSPVLIAMDASAWEVELMEVKPMGTEIWSSSLTLSRNSINSLWQDR
jgi:hypothetical protein